MGRFLRFKAKDAELNAVQENVRDAVDVLLAHVLAGAQLVMNIVVTTSGVQFGHGLGHKAIGWIVVDQNADANVWRSPSTDESRLLKLTSDATVTVSLLVF